MTSRLKHNNAGSDLPGGLGGFNPPNDFFDPPSLRQFELLGGSILTPVLVLHVSAFGASTLSPVGDPNVFFTNRTLQQW